MEKLDPSVILKLLREERAKQLDALRDENPSSVVTEDVMVHTNVDGTPKKIVTPGLKLRDKQGGKLYTVKAVGVDSAILMDPVGQTVNVTDQQLAKGFDLD
mgnify:CR=1 FL=1